MTRRLKEIARKIGNASTLRVGFLEGASYPDGTSVATVAATQNFGSPAQGIPPRPFFSNMIAAKSPEWGRKFAALLRTSPDAETALALMGEGVSAQLRQSILDTDSPALAEATIARKGFDTVLIDTSVMIDSIAYEVA